MSQAAQFSPVQRSCRRARSQKKLPKEKMRAQFREYFWLGFLYFRPRSFAELISAVRCSTEPRSGAQVNGTPIFRGEHCACSCVYPCRSIAEREGYLSTRTLPVFQCSAAIQITGWNYLFSVVGLGEVRICSIRKLDLSLLALHRRSCPKTWQS